MSDHESARALERWLRYARDDLRSAEILLVESGVPRNSCFLAQQAAEKSIKAIFVALQIDFPFTHDLNRLLDLLPEDWEMKEKLPGLTDLSDWAVEPRYPGDMPEATEDDAREAVRMAREVYETTISEIEARGFGAEP
ncbi:MAG: HEPN domain-containing protein [Rubrobacter sp.]|jgi:HEPN domain-containing protein|nr:HEPN domain-containing protein [Rubrobacter sp.]